MSYIHITPLLFLLPFIIGIQYTLTVEAIDPLYHICSSIAGDFTPKTLYERNLNSLMGILSRELSPLGFSRATTYPANFNGIALCRGDVNAAECNTCVVDASTELRKRCPFNKGAAIWYDNCLLKYLDTNFFGQIDNNNKFYLYNVVHISNNPTLFNQKVKEFLSKLADEGASNRKLYAAGEMNLDTVTNLYGLAQCTQDLSSTECKSCLEEAISDLPNCCDGKQGGRVVGGSCNFRYELYPFVNS